MSTNLPQHRLTPSRPTSGGARTLLLRAGIAVLAVLTSAATPAVAAWGGPRGPVQPTPGIEKQTSDLLTATIKDAQAAPAARTEAAGVLVQRALVSEVERGPVEQILSGPATEGSAAWYVLGCLSRQSTLPAWTQAALQDVIVRGDERSAARAVTGLGGIRTREVARALLSLGTTDRRDAVRKASWVALARLSGRADLLDDAAQWRAWLDQAESLSRDEWSQQLEQGLARRADAADAARQSAVSRLVEAYRRVHVSLPPEQRSEFLAGLLRDDTDDVRSLGFELVLRELSENARLGTAVESAAIALLDAPLASVRERAGLLIAQLSPASARGSVTTALQRETDPAAAAALLRAASRWPDEAMLETALSWVKRPGSARASAVDYIRALMRAGFIQSPQTRAEVLDALRALAPGDIPPGACDLLVHLGTEDDVKIVAQLLSKVAGPVRLAAAQALLAVPDHIDDILLAAQDDPELFDVAARGVTMYWPTAEGFRSISALKAPTQEAWRRGLLKLAEMMPAPDLVDVAQTAEPGLREPLLANLSSVNRILSERYSTPTFEALGKGLVELARLRLELNKPDAALAALDSMQELPVLQGESVVNTIRVESLLCLGRIAEAAAVPAGPSPWIAAMTRSLDKPFVRTMADEFKSKFAGELTPEESMRVQALLRRLPHAEADATPSDAR